VNRQVLSKIIALSAPTLLCAVAFAQPPAQAPGGRGAPRPNYVSPEVMPDHKIAFRIYAPKAESVRVQAGDIPGMGQAGQMTKNENGVWELVFGPVDPGAYRYVFMVDGVTAMDSKNPSVSESNATDWSLVYVPGAEFMDTNKVPHGAIASVTYYSNSLEKFRRLHVYTPPGYETSSQKYPVFYLLHGAGDSDDSWSSVGRAGFIFDNLIAAKKAKPMVVVMPAGHTTLQGMGGGRGAGAQPGRAMFNDDFVRDFDNDIMPLVETRYRVINDRAHRAIAGLSMGGAHTLNIGIPHLDKFAYMGVFSSGLLGVFPTGGRGRGGQSAAPPATPPTPDPTWEKENAAQLDNPALKKGLKLFWFSTGSDDGLLANTKSTVELFKKHGFTPVFQESSGGHTWINWRNYLNEFAPQLFQ
jgi:enterochelin esterase-like enzyme